jgi:hypothetical protein
MFVLLTSQSDMGLLCNSDTNLEEMNIGHCVNNAQNIHPQKNLHKLALPRCIFEGGGGSDSKIQVASVRKIPEH